jgi:hypothetical protein
MDQPNLFEQHAETIETERVLLYALGDFQSRGKVLENREIALDRLRGAFKRACYKFEIAEFSDEVLAENLAKLDVKITKLPSFVAKHPFRITVSKNVAANAIDIYNSALSDD